MDMRQLAGLMNGYNSFTLRCEICSLQQLTVAGSCSGLAETILLGHGRGVPLHHSLSDNIVHQRLTDVPVS